MTTRFIGRDGRSRSWLEAACVIGGLWFVLSCVAYVIGSTGR